MTIRVAVLGAQGRMGQTTCEAIRKAPDMDLVAQVDLGDDLSTLSGQVDVAVDFTLPDATEDNVTQLISMGIHAVVGTTGWDAAALERIEQKSAGTNVGVLIAPNFALSAVLAMRFATQAAQYFESVEVIELHHPNKVDAPSGTAIHTAKRIAPARAETGVGPSPDATETGQAARGMDVDGVSVHAVRLQ